MNNRSQLAAFPWSIAELFRNAFKGSKYRDVILPLTALAAIVAPLGRPFHDAGSATCEWILTNRKEERRRYGVLAFQALSDITGALLGWLFEAYRNRVMGWGGSHAETP